MASLLFILKMFEILKKNLLLKYMRVCNLRLCLEIIFKAFYMIQEIRRRMNFDILISEKVSRTFGGIHNFINTYT